LAKQIKNPFLKANNNVQCPTRMGDIYHAERYIIEFLKKEYKGENEIVTFAQGKILW
jgi:hypothetical protein